ncbi:MAG: argininosuccinate synthase [Gemmatimonadales bacterium]|jgi:argininosuccinate synthase
MQTEKSIERIALAYSGGLDTSVMIPWLHDTYDCEVVAVVADVGQQEDFEAVREKALRTGAIACEVIDLKAEFAADFVFPALRAGALYERGYLLGTALARPLIARAQVEAALAHGCDALAHGCTGKGNDQVRFEVAYRTLAPRLMVVAPWREWELRSREDEFAYAEARGISLPVTPEKPYSIDQNLWHTSTEGGILEDPAMAPPDDIYQITTDPADAPDEPRVLEISFERGFPTAVDGRRLEPWRLIQTLNEIAGCHGVGRCDLVESRLVGMKSRGVYETPAGTVLHSALRDLESLTLDHATSAYKEGLATRYGELVYQGHWFTALRESLDAFLDASHQTVTGTVSVKLFKGTCMPVSRVSPFSLYQEDLATFGEDAVYDHQDAAGFIRLWGLPAEVRARVMAGPAGPSVARAESAPASAPDSATPESTVPGRETVLSG